MQYVIEKQFDGRTVYWTGFTHPTGHPKATLSKNKAVTFETMDQAWEHCPAGWEPKFHYDVTGNRRWAQ